jgi:hypothetical protein
MALNSWTQEILPLQPPKQLYLLSFLWGSIKPHLCAYFVESVIHRGKGVKDT